MKTKYIILAAALICTTATWAQNGNKKNKDFRGDFISNNTQPPVQQTAGTVEEELRDKLLPILLEAGYDAKYYNQDGEKSVDFKYNGNNYWYSAESGRNGILELSLNRNGKKMYSDEGDKMYNEDTVLDAINEINNKYYSMKMYYDRNKGSIRICQQSLVRSAGVITQEIVKRSLNDMETACKEYERVYNDLAGSQKVVNNPESPGGGVVFAEKPVSKLDVSQVILESVDGKGESIAVIANGTIAHKDMQFVHPILVCSSSEVAKYDISIKILNDKNEMLRYEDETEVTIRGQVDIKKKGREQEESMGAFGSPDYNDWAKGTYTVEVYEGDARVATEQFTIK